MKRIVPPSPLLGVAEPMIGWKRSMCRRSQSPSRSQCSLERVEHLAGAADERLALAPVGAQLVEVGGADAARARR